MLNKKTKEEIMKKWAPIIDSMGTTDSKADWLNSDYSKINLDIETNLETKSEDDSTEFLSLLPIAMKVASRTISQDLVFASKEEIDSVKSRIIQENRDGKIESIIEDKPFSEKKLEEDEEYKKLMKKGVVPMSGPSNQLFYLDYQYGGTASK
jgi:hypothetical protein